LILILIGRPGAYAQAFVNLDFEDANLAGYSPGSVPAADAIPGWTAYIGGTALTFISNSNSPPRTGNIAMVEIIGANTIQGNYYINLQGLDYSGIGSPSNVASIDQTGTIPTTAQSLIFFGLFNPLDTVSFNGQTLFLSVIGSASTYAIYGADISAIAGQTGQLLFTATHSGPGPSDSIDNIQFSSSPIPEPSSEIVLGLGGLGFLWHRRKAKAVAAAIWIAAAGSALAQGSVIFQHVGATDPTTEGFSLGGPGSVGPVINDLGLNAWTTAVSGPNQNTFYGQSLTAQQIVQLAGADWVMSVTLRVVQPSSIFGNNEAAFDTGSDGINFFFGSEPNRLLQNRVISA
jgi:hypothetical protein